MPNLFSRRLGGSLYPRRLSSPHLLALRISFALLLTSLAVVAAPASAGAPYSLRKQEARTQFDKAEQLREELNGRPAAERTHQDYKRVIDAYRRVYYVAPASSKADASVLAVAELEAEMGRQFVPGEKDLRSAITEYQFLRKEYPGSKYRFEALFTIGQIYRQDLNDDAAARAAFEEFVRRYPHHSLVSQARQELAELDQPKQPAAKQPVVDEAHIQPPDATDASSAPVMVAQKKPGSPLPRVTGIRYWSTPDYTRVAIDVDDAVKYEAGRVPSPDRIFFDLPGTKLASVLVGKSFDVQDGFLKKIRVAQYQRDSTRVVLEVADVSDYSAFLLPNPYRLIIDIHGRQPRAATQVAGGTALAGEHVEANPAAAKSVPVASESVEHRSAPADKQAGRGDGCSSWRKSEVAAGPAAAFAKFNRPPEDGGGRERPGYED